MDKKLTLSEFKMSDEIIESIYEAYKRFGARSSGELIELVEDIVFEASKDFKPRLHKLVATRSDGLLEFKKGEFSDEEFSKARSRFLKHYFNSETSEEIKDNLVWEYCVYIGLQNREMMAKDGIFEYTSLEFEEMCNKYFKRYLSKCIKCLRESYGDTRGKIFECFVGIKTLSFDVYMSHVISKFSFEDVSPMYNISRPVFYGIIEDMNCTLTNKFFNLFSEIVE